MKNKLWLSLSATVVLVVLIMAVSRGKFLSVDEKVTQIQATPERLARGEYLASHVTICLDCHSKRDWSFHSGPVVPGTEGMGGEKFGPDFGLPGNFYPRNITPAGIGHWTDEDVIKALTQGINKDGEKLFPIMPYMFYRNLTQEDLYSIIAYIRSLKPIENTIPAREPFRPIDELIPFTPEPVQTFATYDKKKDPIGYGKYLTTIAVCSDCHTPMENGQFIEGKAFAGGYEFILPNGKKVISQNITPDPETGIGGWDKKTFITVFRAYSKEEVMQYPIGKNDNNTIMPWTMYAGMTDEDLGAIYDYLRTVKPVKNKVERFFEHPNQ